MKFSMLRQRCRKNLSCTVFYKIISAGLFSNTRRYCTTDRYGDIQISYKCTCFSTKIVAVWILSIRKSDRIEGSVLLALMSQLFHLITSEKPSLILRTKIAISHIKSYCRRNFLSDSDDKAGSFDPKETMVTALNPFRCDYHFRCRLIHSLHFSLPYPLCLCFFCSARIKRQWGYWGGGMGGWGGGFGGGWDNNYGGVDIGQLNDYNINL